MQLIWNQFFTAGVVKTVPSVYTLSINTIYSSHSTQVAGETILRKHTVAKGYSQIKLTTIENVVLKNLYQNI